MATGDPRQRALFGAAWAPGYLARAAQGGVDGVTIMAPTGPFGVVGERGARPVFRILQGFAAMAGASVLNLTPHLRKVAVAGFRPATVAAMDETSGAKVKERPLTRSPLLELGAYAIARLEG